MELTRDALLRVVKATRACMQMSDGIRKLLGLQMDYSTMDEIVWLMSETLYSISGEHVEATQDFMEDSKVMKLMHSMKTAEEITDEIVKMAEVLQPEQVKIPKPHTMRKEEMEEWNRKCEGYKPGLHETPEGEWTR